MTQINLKKGTVYSPVKTRQPVGPANQLKNLSSQSIEGSKAGANSPIEPFRRKGVSTLDSEEAK